MVARTAESAGTIVTATAGMPADEFVRRFGGSCRTKKLFPLPRRRREWARFGWDLARGRAVVGNRRLWSVPVDSELPAEFIRLDPWEAEYLYVVAGRATRGIVEIGRWDGGSTFLLACANSTVPIWSIDLAPRDDGRLQQFFAEFGVGANVTLLTGHSVQDDFPAITGFDVLFVDGDHSYEGCLGDLERYHPRLAPGGHVVIHDCYEGWPVQQAVIDFVESSDVQTVRSPFIPMVHWQTDHGSLAHVRKPPEPHRAPERVTPARPSLRRLGPPVHRRPSPPPRHGRRTRTKLAIAVCALLVVLFGVLPEALGDQPYNVVGHHAQPASRTAPGNGG